MPLHAIVGGDLKDKHIEILEHFNITVWDYRGNEEWMKSIWNPVYTKQTAKKTMRIFDPTVKIQTRQDGWATYFKFFAWKNEE